MPKHKEKDAFSIDNSIKNVNDRALLKIIISKKMEERIFFVFLQRTMYVCEQTK
jgi:hypothetical protein